MKIDRMIGILAILLQRDSVTAPELARRFEVSRRTILRDVDSLCRAGIPIAARQGTGGGFAIMEGYRVDRALLTGSEMQAILAGLRSLDSVSGTRRYTQLMEKLSAGSSAVLPADGRILIDLASWYREPLSEKIETLHAAIAASRVVRFRYHAPGGESEREVEPAYIVYRWSDWYVYGWCRTREDWRLFKLNRLTELQTGEPFPPRETPWPDFSSERVFPDRWRVKALVEPRFRWRLIEEFGPDCYVEQPDGRLLFERGFADRNNVISWLLSLEDGAELLEPREFRAEMARLAGKLADIYGTHGTVDRTGG